MYITTIALEILEIAEEVVGVSLDGSRGQQVVRKDKDLMRDTGGTSKGRDREPHQKPPRDDVKERYRDKRKKPPQKDNDTNENKDREVKHPSRRPQASKRVVFRAYISKMYFPKEMWPDAIGNDAMYSWKIRGEKGQRADAAMELWRKYGRRILKEVNPWVKKISLNVSGGTGMGSVEYASRLSPIRVHPVLKASEVHPLDRVNKEQWLGMDIPEDNYHRQVKSSLHCIMESEQHISEKDFKGQDWLIAETDRIVRTPDAEGIIQRFSRGNFRPMYCAECIFAEIVMVK